MRHIDFTNTQVASSETARDINRSVVLNLIRRRQPISRADLARLSGLQRSTVSLITEQLIRQKWVVEGPTGRLPRGRRPTFLRLNDKRAILVADLRPDHTTVAIADVNGRFLAQEAIPTPAHPRTTAENLAQRFRALMKMHPTLLLEGIGISVPGRFDQQAQQLVFAPNLKWPDFDLKSELEEAMEMPVEIENAANACVLSQIWFGHAEKVTNLVVVTVVEGVGTGIYMNGQLVRGMKGMAGEFGHVSIDPDGLPCNCGGTGCWELYASNRAALRYYHESQATPEGMTFRDLLALAQAGDKLAEKALDRMAHAIGKGMRMITAALAPEEFVVVGELTSQWHRFGPVIQAEVKAGTLVGTAPHVRPAEGSMARLQGTVAVVLQRHFGPYGTTVKPEQSLPVTVDSHP